MALKDEAKSGWQLLHSKLPAVALKPLPKAAYGIEGLTDVNEAYLIQRLFAADLAWEWKITSQAYLGFEDRTGRESNYTTRYYLASVSGEIIIEGRAFAGSGAHDNKKLDAAYKGAATVAFKNACKLAGLTIELFKDGKAMDFIYEGNGTAPASPPPLSSVPLPIPASEFKTPEQILAETRAKLVRAGTQAK